MGRVIVVTSGKGGVGKTTVSANLGVALAASGKRTLVIDTDTGLRNLDIALGVEDGVVYDIIDVANNTCSFENAAIVHEKYADLYILPASQTKEKEELSIDSFKELCDSLKKRFDYIIIDCPAGIEYGFECAIAPADEAIIITAPDKTSMRDADKVAGLIEERHGGIKMWMCINRLIPELAKKGVVAGAEEALFTVAVKLIGIIPEDPRVLIDGYESQLVVNDKRSLAGKAIKNIAKRIDGADVKLLDFSKKRLFKKRYR